MKSLNLRDTNHRRRQWFGSLNKNYPEKLSDSPSYSFCNTHMHHQQLKCKQANHQPPISIVYLRDAACKWLILTVIITLSMFSHETTAQQQQNFLLPNHNMENLRIPESQPVDSIVYHLKAADRNSANRRFSYHMASDTFSVGELTGEVRLIKPLDREKQSQIIVVVSIFDLSDIKNDSPLETKRRIIFIEDIDDSWPIFASHKNSVLTVAPQYLYQVDLSELVSVGSIVIGEIFVTDADEGPNAEIIFECRAKLSNNGACDVFGIESRRLGSGKYSVSLRSKQALDYERVQTYKLSLVARGKRPSPLKGVPLETEAVINFNVLNIQDEGPVFLNAPYSISMHEGQKAGTRLLNLIAQDGDLMPQRELNIIVVAGPFSDYFQIIRDPDNSKIWYLETNATIDREDPSIVETNGLIGISLLAAELDETGAPIATETELFQALREPNYFKGTLRKENITIMILDLPDSRPEFVFASSGLPIVENVLIVNVSESVPNGASLPNLDLAVQDLDQSINSRFNLSLLDASGESLNSPMIALESRVVYGRTDIVLKVVNSSLLDYEDQNARSYRFNLVASKSSDPSLVQILELYLNILDANDNSPEFDRDQYVVDVEEGAPSGNVITTIKAVDKDSGAFGSIEYSLRGHGSNKFKVAPGAEGKIILEDCGAAQCLDYETQPVYSLTYEARDKGGRSKNVNLIINLIDINDHAPKFTEQIYKRELISDNFSTKQNYISPQLIVRADDADGPSQGRNNITYKIVNSNLSSLDVDPKTGLVYLTQALDLETASTNTISFNDKSLEREGIYEAEIIAEDNGFPKRNSSAKILLVVKGNPEGAPRFKQDHYLISVKENQVLNKPFFKVLALDPDDKDSQLRYSLGNDLNDLINIDPNTGEISFAQKVDYDDFRGSPYNITIYATDNSKPYPLRAMTTVSILIQDVNNKRPKFEQHEYKSFLVQGRTKVGDPVLRLHAVDQDKNSLLNFSIIEDKLFVLDRNGQQFTLEDLVNSTSGYLSQIPKSDRAQLIASSRGLLEINRTSGIIELKSEPDYSFAAAVTILVKVQDLNQEVFSQSNELQQDFVPVTFFLQTHIDKSPIFSPPWSIDRRDYNISILEELSIDTVIFSLLAKDPVTNQRIDNFEKIFESNSGELLRVDKNGVVYINKRIDFEKLPGTKSITLSVKAISGDNSSGIYYSTANLNIQVIDVNDNAPSFKKASYSVTISESITHSQEIISVEAEDNDSGEFGTVHYSLSGHSNEKFDIDQKKGVITLKKNQKLDRDTESSHTLLVTASNCNEMKQKDFHEDSKCKKSSTVLTINLSDENDNDPIFTNVNKNGEISAVISETVSVGTVITQVVATDVDEGINGKVSYEISQNDYLNSAGRLVKVDQDGYISVAESLSGLGRLHPYKIIIRAYDHGKMARQAFSTLLLNITDVVSNDGVPRFVRPSAEEVISISEGTGPGEFIYQVQAVDPDEEASGRLIYRISSASDMFEIDPDTGVIKTQSRSNFYLDREVRSNYTLVIMAQDLGTPPKQAYQVFTIKITDVNDNEPYFERGIDDPPVTILVHEEIPKDSLIGKIQAIDKDDTLNAMIGYEIIEGNGDNLFRIETDSSENGNNACRIFSSVRLDREIQDSYMLTIRATSVSKMKNSFINQLEDPMGGRNSFNQYNASDLSKIRVIIRLIDINDNRPVFVKSNFKSIVDSNAEVYSQLMVLKATDKDSSDDEIRYSILDVFYYNSNQPSQESLSKRNVFEIDSLSGILRNSKPLRQYIDGYFEVFIKADNGPPHQLSNDLIQSLDKFKPSSSCNLVTSSKNTSSPFADMESCYATVTKAVIFVSHQRETFKFVFNKTKLNDRLDEFKSKIQAALEEIMFDGDSRVQASTDLKAERVYMNTLNTDFYEHEDGRLDYSTLTSCSQLVKFDDRQTQQPNDRSVLMLPNQVINYNDVLYLLKQLNATQMRQQKSSLLSQYGVIGIERCLTDRNVYRMSISEKASIYFAVMIAVVGLLLAMVVSRMRKSYEKKLKQLQRSKYQYINQQYASMQPSMQAGRPIHHMSLGALQSGNMVAPSYGSHLDYDGTAYDTWQL